MIKVDLIRIGRTATIVASIANAVVIGVSLIRVSRSTAIVTDVTYSIAV